MIAVHTNFDEAFKHGRVFNRLGETLTVSVVRAGNLVLPSGRLLAHDPCSLSYVEKEQGFIRKVKPGEYPVFLSVLQSAPELENENIICAAMVRILDEPIVSWEIALRPGESFKDVDQYSIPAHSVDSGLSCFVDLEAILKMKVDERDSIYELLEENLSGNRDDCAVAEISKKTKANIVVFSSAFGDGGYCDYWGLTKSGAVAALATDFFVLIEDIFLQLNFNVLESLPLPFLNDAKLSELNLQCKIEKLSERRVKVIMKGPSEILEGRLSLLENDSIQGSIVESFNQGDHSEYIFELTSPLTSKSALLLDLRTGILAID